jgi:hypothetical protein
VLLCATEGGTAHPLTETHHADARGEAARLRRLGAGLVTDSFGEARLVFSKRFGIVAEFHIIVGWEH